MSKLTCITSYYNDCELSLMTCIKSISGEYLLGTRTRTQAQELSISTISRKCAVYVLNRRSWMTSFVPRCSFSDSLLILNPFNRQVLQSESLLAIGNSMNPLFSAPLTSISSLINGKVMESWEGPMTTISRDNNCHSFWVLEMSENLWFKMLFSYSVNSWSSSFFQHHLVCSLTNTMSRFYLYVRMTH